MANFTKITPQWAALVALLASLALIAGAHAFELWGGLAPCPLCLRQREAHWTASALAALILAASARPEWRPRLHWATSALGLVYLVSAGIAAYHAGVEWGIFEAPSSCSAGAQSTFDSAADLLRRLQAPAEAPACDQVAWSLFGLSLAGYNTLFSLALAGLSAVPALRKLSTSERSKMQSA